jgi:hypothetical protein
VYIDLIKTAEEEEDNEENNGNTKRRVVFLKKETERFLLEFILIHVHRSFYRKFLDNKDLIVKFLMGI